MTHAAPASVRDSLLGHLLRLLGTATRERMILPDVDGKEMEEHILLESHLVRTPPLLLAAPTPPLL